jgi:hypothetical protein
MKLSPLMRQYVWDRGWHILQLWQPQRLFPDDGRRLKRCPIPSDPWSAILGDATSYLYAERRRMGEGATADEAIMAALTDSNDLRSALDRLAAACDDLAMVYRR